MPQLVITQLQIVLYFPFSILTKTDELTFHLNSVRNSKGCPLCGQSCIRYSMQNSLLPTTVIDLSLCYFRNTSRQHDWSHFTRKGSRSVFEWKQNDVGNPQVQKWTVNHSAAKYGASSFFCCFSSSSSSSSSRLYQALRGRLKGAAVISTQSCC